MSYDQAEKAGQLLLTVQSNFDAQAEIYNGTKVVFKYDGRYTIVQVEEEDIRIYMEVGKREAFRQSIEKCYSGPCSTDLVLYALFSSAAVSKVELLDMERTFCVTRPICPHSYFCQLRHALERLSKDVEALLDLVASWEGKN